MERLKKLFSVLFRVGISIAIIIFLLRQVDLKSILGLIKNVDIGFLFWAFVVFFSGYILCLFRWEMLLKAADIHLPLKRIIISFSGGIFFSLFLPSTIGGDFVRSVDLAAHTKKPHEVVATVLLDRLSGYIGLVIVTLFALLFGWELVNDRSVIVAVCVITGLLVVVLFVLFNNFAYTKINKILDTPRAGKIKESLRNLHQELYIFRSHKTTAVKNIIISVLIQLTSPVTFYILALSLGIKAHFLYFFVFLPIIGAITLLPISIGGLGLRDATTIFFFAKADVAKDMAFAMSLLNFFFIVICAGIGGLIYVLTVHHRRVQYHKT